MKNISVIGAGISGLAASAILAGEGHNVTVFEKNGQPGGRLRTFSERGFSFDMGPSWYWMPDVFERFYNLFGNTAPDFYHLKKLEPSFRIYFDNEHLDVPSTLEEIIALFGHIEPGADDKLRNFLKDAESKYVIGMKELVYMPAYSVSEYIKPEMISAFTKLSLFTSMGSYISKSFKDVRLRAILEFPVLFLGGLPSNTPALYSMMNHAQLTLGTWYPKGGMSKITESLVKIANDRGVKIRLNDSIREIRTSKRKVNTLVTDTHEIDTDLVIGSSDYAHTEQLLEPGNRNYSDKYWNTKVFAPSCMIYYVGVSKKLDHLVHHNLFFDADFRKHSMEIYKHPAWPTDPQFYVCCPSKTDDTVSPEGMENLFILIPVAPGLQDDPAISEQYFEMIIDRIEKRTGKFRDSIVVKRSYSVSDFRNDYNAYKGNAYGLANTLMQTAFMKPCMRNKKVDNLFYCGHLTVPGPGLPPSLISGEIAAREALKMYAR